MVALQQHDFIISELEKAKGVKKRCLNDNGVSYCVYSYTHRRFPEFVRDPGAVYARGAVVINAGGEKILRLPFTKFFNIDETPYTTADKLSMPKDVFEKIDGTLVIAWRDPVTGAIRVNTRSMLWGQKPGKVDNFFVKQFMDYIKRKELEYELENLIGDNNVAMFEVFDGVPASAPRARGAKRRPPTAYLLAVRDMNTLQLHPPSEYEWPDKPRQWSNMELPELVRRIRAQSTSEGTVVWLPGIPYPDEWKLLDPLVKVKSTRYLIRVTGGGPWVLRMLLNGNVDDLYSIMPDKKDKIEKAVRELEKYYALVQRLRSTQNIPSTVLRNRILSELVQGTRPEKVIWRHAPKQIDRLVEFMKKLNKTIEYALTSAGKR